MILSIFSACDNKEEETVDPLVGKYIISDASLASDLIYQDNVVLPGGTDLTSAVNVALLGDAGCTNAANTRLELKNNGQIWYVCETEGNEMQNGTWQINELRTELTLALNIQGNVVPLNITGLQESSNKASGTVNGLPLPPEFFLAVGVDLTGSGVPVFQVNLFIEISKVP
jgi:hypothetical protein